MSEDKPCCAAAAAARLRYLNIGGHRIAIAQLDRILKDAGSMSSGGEGAVRRELLRLVKVYNYVPPSAEKDYEDALFAEYLRSGRQGDPEPPVKKDGARSQNGGGTRG